MLRHIAPSAIGGHAKRPCSSHLVARMMPVPSHASSLIRSARFDRKTKISPPYGSAPSVCATRAASPWTPRRKSTGCVATHTRSPARAAINARLDAPPPKPATASPCRHPARPGCWHPPARSRSGSVRVCSATACPATIECQPANTPSHQPPCSRSPAQSPSPQRSVQPLDAHGIVAPLTSPADARWITNLPANRVVQQPPTPSSRQPNSPPRSPPYAPLTNAVGDHQRHLAPRLSCATSSRPPCRPSQCLPQSGSAGSFPPRTQIS